MLDSDRLNVLRSHRILDTPPEPTFDGIVSLARQICGTPTALVSLVDADRQWFKARVGFLADETDLDRSVCRHVVAERELLVIPDLRADPRTRDNPLVTGDPAIRFYAGAPLTTASGHVLGALCVIDRAPRPGGLTDEQAAGLTALACQTVEAIELRRSLREHQAAVTDCEQARLAQSEADRRWQNIFQSLREGFILGQVIRDDAGRVTDWRYEAVNRAWADLVGIPVEQAVGNTIRGILPDIEDAWVMEFAQVIETGEPIRFTRQVGMLGRWYDGMVQPAGPDQFTVLFTEVTGRLQRERRQDAVVELSDLLRDATNVDDMTLAASAIMARALDAQLVGYGDVDPVAETITVERDWATADADTLAGTLGFRDFGSYIDDLKRGDIVVIGDCRVDPRTRGFAGALEARSARAFVNMPVFERGVFVGLLYVSTGYPREWSGEELAFIRDAATRVRAAIARLLTETQLQESEERLRLVVEGASDHAILTTGPDGIITSWSAGAEGAFGWPSSKAIGRRADIIFTPDDRVAGVPARELDEARRSGCASDARWHQRQDGSRVYMNGSVHPLPHDPQGRERGFLKIARDETQRRHDEEALRASETSARVNAERVQLALAAGAIIGTWFWDIRADRFTVDEGFAEAFGLDPALGREGLSLQQIIATVHPDDRDGLTAAINEAIGRGGAYAHQYRVRRTDGRYHWIEANGRVDLGEDGAALFFPGVLLDVARRRYEAVLADFADRLRTMSDPIAMKFAAAEVVGTALGLSRAAYGDVDESAKQIMLADDWRVEGQPSASGLHSFEAYGSYIEELRRGEDVAIADVEDDPRTAGQAQSFAPLGIRALANLPLMDQARLSVVFCLHHMEPHAWTPDELVFARRVMDRTEVEIARHAAETARRAGEERYRTLFENIDAGFCIAEVEWDDAGRPVGHRIVEANPAFGRHAGLTDPARRHSDDTTPFTDQHWLHALGRVARTGEPVRFEGGNEALGRWYDAHLFPATEGRVAMLIVDITGRRLAEEELKILNGTLEQRVGERTAELMQAEDALRQSQKMEAVGQLTGGVAHDFNNLLTVIRGSVDLLRRPDLAEERRQKYIDAVSDTVDRAARLTGQLLAFARRSALKPEVFDVRAKLRGVSEMLDTVTGARVQVALELPGHACFVRADVSQFETALVNLSVNARDAMGGEGRLTLSVGCGVALPAIRGHTGSTERFTAVSVRDTGCGIPPEQMARIFEPFFTTKEVGRGTGLGLSQVFGFAKQSGGDVDVSSVPGEETIFTLYLPEAPEPAKADGEAAGKELAPLGGGRRVLVVEDNIEVGQFCTQILEDLGYSTELVGNAEEALTRLGADGAGFDAVFSDVVMPGMGGLELATVLRKRLPMLPVVLASGYSHVLAANADHGFELLHKPYSADQLAQVLRRVTT